MVLYKQQMPTFGFVDKEKETSKSYYTDCIHAEDSSETGKREREGRSLSFGKKSRFRPISESGEGRIN